MFVRREAEMGVGEDRVGELSMKVGNIMKETKQEKKKKRRS
jgi:hypothetical protein